MANSDSGDSSSMEGLASPPMANSFASSISVGKKATLLINKKTTSGHTGFSSSNFLKKKPTLLIKKMKRDGLKKPVSGNLKKVLIYVNCTP